MIIRLQETDLALVLDFKLRKLEQSGRCQLPRDWQKRSRERYQNLYREGKLLHFGRQVEGRMVAIAGALLCDETPFLATQEVRYGMIVDECGRPEHRDQESARLLRDKTSRLADGKGRAVDPDDSAKHCPAGLRRRKPSFVAWPARY
jgi:hypothetical protein